MTRVPLSCPACSLEINYYFPSDLTSIWLLCLFTLSLFLSFLLCHQCHSTNTHISIFSLSLHAVNFVSPPPTPHTHKDTFFPFSVDIWLLFGDLKPRVPPTPSVRLMFDKGPLKCADFRGCLADGLVGLQRVQAGGLPSERDQLLPRYCYPRPFPSPGSLAPPRALGMRRSGKGWAARKVQVSLRARACVSGPFLRMG